MSAYRWDDFQWESSSGGRLLSCTDSGELIFQVQCDAAAFGAIEKQALLTAYFAGKSDGERGGRSALQYEICKLIGAIP